ncbi:MAG TPA: hypothetical protein VK630_19005 [Reyranella sp.]|nr:hypothetical protein [Reyranella sp.]
MPISDATAAQPVTPTAATPAPGTASAPPPPDSLLDAAAAEPAAPIQYQDFTLPKGVEVDGDTLSAAKSLFAEQRLPQEQAQKLVDLYVARANAAAERNVAAWRDTQEKWAGEVKADPDIGGPRFPASVAAASRAIEWARVPGLKEALDMTGAGNNPAIVKAFVRFGQALAEDRFTAGNVGTSDQRSIAERLYNNTPKQSAS